MREKTLLFIPRRVLTFGCPWYLGPSATHSSEPPLVLSDRDVVPLADVSGFSGHLDRNLLFPVDTRKMSADSTRAAPRRATAVRNIRDLGR